MSDLVVSFAGADEAGASNSMINDLWYKNAILYCLSDLHVTWTRMATASETSAA